ncbi:MAG: carbohydrate binding domain-containing protein [Planctomycetota bacterium]
MLVLGVSAIVGVIGFSSLLAVRVQHRWTAARTDALQAQLLADSALQILYTRLADDPAWRDHHTHAQWSSDEPLAEGTLRYRLLDLSAAQDEDLSDDPEDCARLVVRVGVGKAVRLASVALDSRPSLGPEILQNPDLETGNPTPFVAYIDNTVDLQTTADSPAEGQFALHALNRDAAFYGPTQDLRGQLTDGEIYQVAGDFRMQNSPDQLTVGLTSPGLLGLPRYHELTPDIGTEWTHVTGRVTLELTAPDPIYLNFNVATLSGTQPFYLDNVSVRQVLSDGLQVVRGSYRRELDE